MGRFLLSLDVCLRTVTEEQGYCFKAQALGWDGLFFDNRDVKPGYVEVRTLFERVLPGSGTHHINCFLLDYNKACPGVAVPDNIISKNVFNIQTNVWLSRPMVSEGNRLLHGKLISV